MNSWNKMPFLKLLFPFIAGIIAAVYYPYSISYISVSVSVLFFIISVFVLINKFHLHYRKSWIFGIIAYVLFFLLGFQLTTIKTEINALNHFSKIVSNQELLFHCAVIESPVEKEKSIKVVLRVMACEINSKSYSLNGKLMGYIEKSEKAIHLKYGDEIVIKSRYKSIPSPQNPGEFNYKRYLSFHNIHHQTYLKNNDWISIGKNSGNPIVKFALSLRDDLLSVFKSNGIKGEEYAVASALLLGYEDKLDAEIIAAYSGTGALHVLSVSGLHVGIIFIVFNWLLLFLDKIKNGIIIKTAVLLLLLWFYATITGLSPSVLRSATMFSFIIIGKAFNQHTNMYNTLGVSAFFLLLFNPYIIMEVGFQLSYLAVVGIVFIHPKIYNWITFENKILDHIWSISAISIAAQIATFPLGLHYFHQFPNYFLLSNLIVIPVSTIIIYLGICVFVFAKLPAVCAYIAIVFNALVWFLNFSVKWMEKLPYALIDGISISVLETWLIYATISLLMFYFIKRKYVYLIYSLVAIVSILICQVIEQRNEYQQKKMIVYNVPKLSAIDFIYGKENLLLADSTLLTNESRLLFHIKHNWWDMGLKKTHMAFNHVDADFVKMKNNFLQFNDIRIKLINKKTNKYTSNSQPIKVDYLIISENPEVKIKDVLKNIKAKKIIFDSSNSNYSIKKWKTACIDMNQDYYSVADSGAFVLDI